MTSSAVPFGISSQSRLLPVIDGESFFVQRSRGARLFDTYGRSYVDYGMAMGANLIGHAHPSLVEACTVALRNGPMPGFQHEGEEKAGQALARAGGRLSRVTFTTTGTEAVHMACRIARAATGRTLIAKAVGGYDGWFEELRYGLADSPEAERSNTRPVRGDMTLLRFNEINDLEQLFVEQPGRLAAILVEPMVANAGCLMPDRTYFERLTALARQHGTMIIADEVMVGLRLGLKLVSEQFGLFPDLVTMGKAIGNGIPVAAVLGTPEAFAVVDSGILVRNGTYHGNPLVTAAVLATLDLLEKSDYQALFSYGARLRTAVADAFAGAGIPVSTSGFDSVFSLWFSAVPPATYDEAVAVIQREASRIVYEELRRNGVVAQPSPWGRLFISFEHGPEELEISRKAFEASALALARAGVLRQ